MKYFSLFSGIGGFEHGIEQALQNNVCLQRGEYKTKDSGYQQNGRLEPERPERLGYYDGMQTKRIQQGTLNRDLSNPQRPQLPPKPLCVGFSEIDKYAIQIYKKHFPNHKEYGNVQEINWNDVEDFDLLCGGFPCQAFSIAGKRGGFSDTRGTLFFEVARCASEKHPRLLLLENVKGLLSHDKGRTFGTILNTLDELGYDLQWQVLNSKNFGVPQNRERVFIVGHLRGTSRPEVFPIKGNNQKAIFGTLKCSQGQNRSTSSLYIEEIQPDKKITQFQRDKSDSPNSIRRTTYSDNMRIRRLTPTECERLQSFPDGWTEGISDTQRYKCLGNAVTVNVVETIAEKLIIKNT